MDFKRESKIFAAMLGVFLVAYLLPLSNAKVGNAIMEAFKLLQWYARNHTLACVVPAVFIAGAITTFLSQAAVMKHLGPRSNKVAAYSVASVSGTVLAVCSCSVLPMFAGIYRLGAGLGPASAFLYAGPAINVMAVFLTARVLGLDLGAARAIGAVLFAVVIGLAMAAAFRREEKAKVEAALQMPESPAGSRPLWKNACFLGAMILFLVFSDWFNPGDVVVEMKDGTEVRGIVMQETVDEWRVQIDETTSLARSGERIDLAKAEVVGMRTPGGWVRQIHSMRWYLAALMGLAVLFMAFGWYQRDELTEWMSNSWDFAKLLIPWLFGGVFVVGFIAALLPDEQVGRLVGDNSLPAVLVGSVVGALFYFATLTEVPIVQALMEHGMAPGPSLALLLAGPALSLPNILVIGKVMGAKKTAVFCGLVIVTATIAGMIYGAVT